MELRPYQKKAIDDLVSCLNDDKRSRPLVVAPTGSGKSVIIAAFLGRIIQRRPALRVLIIVPKGNLVKQNAEKMRSMGLDFSVCSASLSRRSLMRPLVIGTPGTLVGALKHSDKAFDVVLVDEAHRFKPDGEGLYSAIFLGLKKKNPKVRIGGFTATPYRMTTGSLIGGTFTKIAHEVSILELIKLGYLCEVTTKLVPQLDISKAKIVAGDYSGNSVAELIDTEESTAAVIKHVLAMPERKRGIVFASNIAHADNFAKALRNAGVTAQAVHSKIPVALRNKYIAAFQRGEINYLVSRDMFVEGFDVPAIDIIVSLRATQSTGLWVQMLGRGMRPHPNKTDCALLDFVGNVERHGFIDDIRVDSFQRKTKKAYERAMVTPIELCFDCQNYFNAKKKCHRCHPPETFKPNHDTVPTDAAVLTIHQTALRLEIHEMRFSLHHGKRYPTLKVEYIARDNYGLPCKTVTDFFIFDEASPHYRKTYTWWQAFGHGDAPMTAQAAVKILQLGKGKPVKFITYRRRHGKYDEIEGYEG